MSIHADTGTGAGTGADTTPWWSARWQDVLDAAGATHARRVQRGRAVARRGQVEDLTIRPGRVEGRVREDRVSPYRVSLRWPVPSEASWDRAIEALGAELRFTAALLEGTLPQDAGRLLAEHGVALTPAPHELERRCTCPERAAWCRHAAAVHAAAGLAFARDPFLLLTLRGRGRDQLLRALRSDRDGDGHLDPGTIDLTCALDVARGDLDAIGLDPHLVDDPAALLRQLGDPPGVDDERALAATITRAAETAWRLAAGDGAEAADQELLLAELRAQRVGTARTLAEALARDEEGVREQLDALFEDGTVLRTGAGDRTKYRAP